MGEAMLRGWVKASDELNKFYVREPNPSNWLKKMNDTKKITLLSASSIEKDLKSGDKVNKTELSKLVAQKLAKKAQEKKITKIYFDRGSYKYHGRIKVFAETLRENGMEF